VRFSVSRLCPYALTPRQSSFSVTSHHDILCTMVSCIVAVAVHFTGTGLQKGSKFVTCYLNSYMRVRSYVNFLLKPLLRTHGIYQIVRQQFCQPVLFIASVIIRTKQLNAASIFFGNDHVLGAAIVRNHNMSPPSQMYFQVK
jgi:hypothetical protein